MRGLDIPARKKEGHALGGVETVSEVALLGGEYVYSTFRGLYLSDAMPPAECVHMYRHYWQFTYLFRAPSEQIIVSNTLFFDSD